MAEKQAKKLSAADFARESLEAAERYHSQQSTLALGNVAGLPPGWCGRAVGPDVKADRLYQIELKMAARGFKRLTPDLWESILESCSPSDRAAAFADGPVVPGLVGAIIYVAPSATGERHFAARVAAREAFYKSLEPRTEKKRIADEVVREVLERLRA